MPRGAAIEPVRARGKEGEFFKIFGNHLLLATAEGAAGLAQEPNRGDRGGRTDSQRGSLQCHGEQAAGEAATLAEFYKTALFAWELVVKQQPGDKGSTIKYCDALVNIGELTKADEVITELAKAHPQDLEVLQLSKNMTARVTMAQGGYDMVTAGEADYRAVLKDKPRRFC